MHKPAHLSALCLLLVTLSACGGTNGTATPLGQTGGGIAGTVHLSAGTATAALAVEPAPDPTQVVPGEFIIRFREPGAGAPEAIAADGTTLTAQRTLALEGTWLFSAGGLDVSRTAAILNALRQRADVLSAEPNVTVKLHAAPNDPHYTKQWHYPAINLPTAWDTTTGTNTTVAVIDSGILYSHTDPAKRHPDLDARVLPGYDFISDPTTANDGDGRDADPYDPGDAPGGQGSYHGSHVAGIIGATTNNATGVAGVNWHARILPVRTVGLQGKGVMSDVIDGLLWSVGKSVPGAPVNPNPASVVNVSLGGDGSCSGALQAALDAVTASGAITVAAAGNENRDAAGAFPANCRNVIAVGATNRHGQRAAYSNYGAPIDVMAPGGDADGTVLSLGYHDAERRYGYAGMAGTSMAAPHVAGLVSLLRAQLPALSLAQAEQLLGSTARPLSATDCQRPSGTECGAGLVDAAAAVHAASNRTYVSATYLVDGQPDPARSKTLDLGAPSGSAPYTLSGLTAGEYRVSAFRDTNGNAAWDSGESITYHPQSVQVRSGQVQSPVDLHLGP